MNAKNGMRAVYPGKSLRDELKTLGLSVEALEKTTGEPLLFKEEDFARTDVETV